MSFQLTHWLTAHYFWSLCFITSWNWYLLMPTIRQVRSTKDSHQRQGRGIIETITRVVTKSCLLFFGVMLGKWLNFSEPSFVSFFFNFSFSVVLGFARQVLYYLSHVPSPIFFSLKWGWSILPNQVSVQMKRNSVRMKRNSCDNVPSRVGAQEKGVAVILEAGDWCWWGLWIGEGSEVRDGAGKDWKWGRSQGWGQSCGW
jgi:hypothetical protein